MAAPLALFVYKRAAHTARTVAALKACDGFADTAVTVFADGPKSAAEADAVDAVRAVVAAELPAARLVAAEANRGLAASIIAGVGEIVAAHGRVIVVEDDLIVAPDFLTFMNAALDRYADEPQVMQVAAFLPALHDHLPSAFFLPQTSSWGWATWARAWASFDATSAGSEVLDSDAATRRRFNRNGTFNYVKLLRQQQRGEIDSWAIRWYWSAFRRGGLVLYPPRSLIANSGFDGSGTHTARGAVPAAITAVVPPRGGSIAMPSEIAVDAAIERHVNRGYRASLRNPLARARALARRMVRW